MDENIRTIRISEESLDAFASFEKDFYDLTLLPFTLNTAIRVECDVTRPLRLEDIEHVLENTIENNVSIGVFFLSWFEPLIVHFYELLELNNLFGEDYSSIGNFRLTFMPQTDEELLRWIISRLLDMFRSLNPFRMTGPAAEYIKAEELLTMIDYHCDEVMLPVEQRHYIDDIKEDFISELDNDLILSELDPFTRKLFKKYVNDLCGRKNFNALKIKGFACSGGNSVFRCDYVEAARCMDLLWREGSFGYAANALGFIYYDGHLTNGIPDYENAFKYFSIGHTFGIYESTFKLSEMFLEGLFVAQNIDMAGSLVEKLYNDTRYRFEDGDYEGLFVEASMHMGMIQLRSARENGDELGVMTSQAFGFFLQAAFGLEYRMSFGITPADKKLEETINSSIEELSEGRKIYKSSYRNDYPGPLSEFIKYHVYDRYTLYLKRLKNDRIKMTVIRNTRDGMSAPPATLLTYREFACCDLTDRISITANNAAAEMIGEEIIFDDIEIENKGKGKTDVRFILEGRNAAVVTAESFTITRPR